MRMKRNLIALRHRSWFEILGLSKQAIGYLFTLTIICFWPLSSALAEGRLDQYPKFASKLAGPHDVQVWLPDGYDPKGQPYPVIYMNDGQNLFEPSHSFGGKDWNVDGTLSRLILEKKVPPAIIVGISSTNLRGREYLPQKIYAHLPDTSKAIIDAGGYGPPISDNYLAFLVTELKPFIDNHYNTAKDADHTSIMGSSMGGLISFYAQMEYPETFGASASLSMHWLLGSPRSPLPEGEDYPDQVISAFESYITQRGLKPTDLRLYFDHGTETLDAKYRPFSLRFESMMAKNGFVRGSNYTSQVFVGTAHTESAWAERLDVPLQFLLSGKTVSHGTLSLHKDYPSKLGPHNVWVWSPDGYDPNAQQRYHVLYMLDGQNLFDASPYSGADWGVAETLSGLIDRGEVSPTIVVGIESREARTREYMPNKVFLATPKAYQKRVIAFSNGAPLSDEFLGFVVNDLKPDIDRRYNTDPSRAATAIMGSSMGGHIALYAMGEYPEVFGGSASLSMPWLMAEAAPNEADVAIIASAWEKWLKTTRLNPNLNHIYSDQGDTGLDTMFLPFEVDVAKMLRTNGYDELGQFQHPVFKDTGHSEIYWRARLSQPLKFLLKHTDIQTENKPDE